MRVIIPAHAPKYLALRSHRNRFGNDGRGTDVVDHVAKIDIEPSRAVVGANDSGRASKSDGASRAVPMGSALPVQARA